MVATTRCDAGIDSALLSNAVGRPVRVQGMRYEGHGWDPKGPASIHRIDTNESDPSYSLAGQLTGLPLKIQFASESFIDEIAGATGTDPVALRLRYLTAPRDIAVVKAAAQVF